MDTAKHDSPDLEKGCFTTFFTLIFAAMAVASTAGIWSYISTYNEIGSLISNGVPAKAVVVRVRDRDFNGTVMEYIDYSHSIENVIIKGSFSKNTLMPYSLYIQDIGGRRTEIGQTIDITYLPSSPATHRVGPVTNADYPPILTLLFPVAGLCFAIWMIKIFVTSFVKKDE